jgi:hypothetical protein
VTNAKAYYFAEGSTDWRCRSEWVLQIRVTVSATAAVENVKEGRQTVALACLTIVIQAEESAEGVVSTYSQRLITKPPITEALPLQIRNCGGGGCIGYRHLTVHGKPLASLLNTRTRLQEKNEGEGRTRKGKNL